MAVSITCTEPSSLPFSERHTATYFPSSEGKYQSIAVVPFASSTLGSRSTRSEATSPADFITTRNGWFFGGWRFMAKNDPRWKNSK